MLRSRKATDSHASPHIGTNSSKKSHNHTVIFKLNDAVAPLYYLAVRIYVCIFLKKMFTELVQVNASSIENVFSNTERELKSDNHQYNTLGRWIDVPSIFFYDFLQNYLQTSFQFIFLFFYNFTKIKIKSF